MVLHPILKKLMDRLDDFGMVDQETLDLVKKEILLLDHEIEVEWKKRFKKDAKERLKELKKQMEK